jgi:hypothetical protein
LSIWTDFLTERNIPASVFVFRTQSAELINKKTSVDGSGLVARLE